MCASWPDNLCWGVACGILVGVSHAGAALLPLVLALISCCCSELWKHTERSSLISNLLFSLLQRYISSIFLCFNMIILSGFMRLFPLPHLLSLDFSTALHCCNAKTSSVWGSVYIRKARIVIGGIFRCNTYIYVLLYTTLQ